MVRYVEADSHLLVCGFACAFETHGEVVASPQEYGTVDVVTLIADSDTALIKGPPTKIPIQSPTHGGEMCWGRRSRLSPK